MVDGIKMAKIGDPVEEQTPSVNKECEQEPGRQLFLPHNCEAGKIFSGVDLASPFGTAWGNSYLSSF